MGINADNRESIEEALEIAMEYGAIDGAHHKMWVIDQMVRSLCQEGEHPEWYAEWVEEHNRKATVFDWDEGIAP